MEEARNALSGLARASAERLEAGLKPVGKPDVDRTFALLSVGLEASQHSLSHHHLQI